MIVSVNYSTFFLALVFGRVQWIGVSSFVVRSSNSCHRPLSPIHVAALLLGAVSDGDTLDLTPDGGVLVLGSEMKTPSETKISDGTKFIISYRGTLAPSDWSADEVVKCWLKEQQGLDDIGDAFLENQVDEATLTNPDVFTEHFVMENLAMGTASKIKVKKLVMAAKRLASTRSDSKFGNEFDSCDRYEIAWNYKPKLIDGMRIALEYMLALNLDHVEVKCRSDYAYGAEGYRKRSGEVVIPPFTSLKFEIDLVEPPP